MRGIGRTLAGKVGLLCLIMNSTSLNGTRADEPLIHHTGVDEQPTPPPGPRPIEIHLGLRVIDFARINVREESYDVHGYVELTWLDARMKLGRSLSEMASAGQWRRISPSERSWTPRLTFSNALDEVRIQSPNLFADDNGNMLHSFEFNGKFSKPLEFRRFPFDSQDLQLYIQLAGDDRQDLTLASADGESHLQGGAFLPDWELGDSTAWVQTDTDPVDGKAFQTFIMATKAHRRSTFYIYRVLLPLTLLVAASWCVFWFDVTQLQPQISTSLSIMLSNVMFSFGIDYGLPRLPYLTVVDRHALLSFLFAFLVIVNVTILHFVLKQRGQEAAEAVQRRTRNLFPFAYLVALVITHGTA